MQINELTNSRPTHLSVDGFEDIGESVLARLLRLSCFLLDDLLLLLAFAANASKNETQF